MVSVRWPRWPPCPYMVKTFKNLFLRNRECLGAESLHTSSGSGGLPKLLKWWSYIDVWPFYGLLPCAFIWAPYICMGKCWEFQTTPPLKPLGQCCSNFMWSLLRLGEWKIAKIFAVHWPQWLPCPYIGKTFKNLLLQNQIIPGALSLHKWWSYVDIWPFYDKVKFASPCICMGPMHLYRKNIENSYFGHLLYTPFESKLDDEH